MNINGRDVVIHWKSKILRMKIKLKWIESRDFHKTLWQF